MFSIVNQPGDYNIWWELILLNAILNRFEEQYW